MTTPPITPSTIPIIDTHLHLWDPGVISYPWLADVPAINRPHLLNDYRNATANLHINQMIFVQCECDPELYLEEARWVGKQAKEDPRIQGIVAWAPLERGEAARDDLLALRAIPRLKGVRRIIQFEDDASFCLQKNFIAGVQLLGEFGLHFEICIKGDEQFVNTIKLVEQCPDVTFILNHIAKPYIADRKQEPWASYMHEIAAHPNVWCKVSGMVNEANMDHWTAADLAPYIESTFAAFGSERTFFGGDWPLVTLASSLEDWYKVIDDWLQEHAPESKQAFFHDNALRAYRLS